MDMTTYISPELMVLVPVIYLIGMALKRSTVRDNLIPALLGLAGVFLAGLWIFATTPIADSQAAASALFGAVTQGIIVAGVAVYGNQIYKQIGKED